MEQKFKACREACGMTQKEVAIALSVSVQAVSYWETGERVPSPEKLIQLADLYRVTIDALFGRNNLSPLPNEKVYTPNEAHLFSIVQRLNSLGIQKVIEYANDLAANDKYTQEVSAASVI